MRWLVLLLAAACGSAPPAANAPPPPKAPPAWQVVKLAAAQQRGLDMAATQIGNVRVLVATPPPGAPAPLLCGRVGGKATFCAGGTCRELDGGTGAPLVACNAETVRALDALILAEHDTDAWPAINDSDATLRALYDRVARDPAGTVASLHAHADDGHIALHWYLLGVYAIGHAAKHEPAPGLSDAPRAVQLPDREVCPNYTAGGESDRWLAERVADEQVHALLRETYDRLAGVDDKMAHNSLEELSGDLLIVAQWQWYRRQSALLASACPAAAAQTFPLMRCRCGAPDHWTTLARTMLPDADPPFSLGATGAMLDLLDHAKASANPQVGARVLAIGALQESALTIGRHACDPATDRTTSIAALEGYRSLDGATELFQPTPAELADVAKRCR